MQLLLQDEFVGSNAGKYKEAELKLLDGVADLRTRCLIAVLFGNDTFPKELKRLTIFKDMGPAAVRGMMKKLGDNHTVIVLIAVIEFPSCPAAAFILSISHCSS
jgi:hypothetical protein